MTKPVKRNTQRWKIALAVLVILAGLAYSGTTTITYFRGIPPEPMGFGEGPGPPGGPGFPPGGPPGPPGQGERQEMFQRFADEAGLTTEQRDQLSALRGEGPPSNPEEFRARFEQMQNIMTPEQQEKFHAGMDARMQRGMQRRLARAQRVLPPNQYRIYEERVQKRAQEMRERMRNGLPPPGGPPPGGLPTGGPPPGGPPGF